jgi:hypothetical protein
VSLLSEVQLQAELVEVDQGYLAKPVGIRGKKEEKAEKDIKNRTLAPFWDSALPMSSKD